MKPEIMATIQERPLRSFTISFPAYVSSPKSCQATPSTSSSSSLDLMHAAKYCSAHVPLAFTTCSRDCPFIDRIRVCSVTTGTNKKTSLSFNFAASYGMRSALTSYLLCMLRRRRKCDPKSFPPGAAQHHLFRHPRHIAQLDRIRLPSSTAFPQCYIDIDLTLS